MSANYFLSTMYGLQLNESDLELITSRLGLERASLFNEGTRKMVSEIAKTPGLENISDEINFLLYQSLNYGRVINDVYVLLKSTFKVENVNQGDGKSIKTVVFRLKDMDIRDSEKEMLDLFIKTFEIENEPDVLNIATLMDI